MHSVLISYSQLKAIRASINSIVYVEDLGTHYRVTTSENRITLYAEVAKGTSDATDLETYVLPYANAPVSREEIRFYTHDFSDISDWDNRTTGDIVSWVSGATTYDMTTFQWKNGSNQVVAYLDTTVYPCLWKDGSDNIIVRYDSRVLLPSASKSTNFTNCAITSCVHNWSTEPTGGSVSLSVATGTSSGYKWTYNSVVVDNVAWVEGNTVVIDGGNKGKLTVTMDATAPIIPVTDSVTVTTSSNSTNDKWIRTDTGANVTTSKWRIKPKTGHKLQVLEAWVQADTPVVIQSDGHLHYQVYSYLPANYLYQGSPAGVYKVKDWDYDGAGTLRSGADGPVSVEPVTLEGHTGPVMTLGYNYTKTKTPVLDSTALQYLDIVLDNNKKVTNTLGAKGTFVCIEWRSF